MTRFVTIVLVITEIVHYDIRSHESIEIIFHIFENHTIWCAVRLPNSLGKRNIFPIFL